MHNAPKIPWPTIGVGITSFVLGSTGLLLCLFPIMGTPISVAGLFGGLFGCSLAFFGATRHFRWSAAAVALSGIALLVNLAIGYAPEILVPQRMVPKMQSVPNRPYVAPPRRSPFGRGTPSISDPSPASPGDEHQNPSATDHD